MHEWTIHIWACKFSLEGWGNFKTLRTRKKDNISAVTHYTNIIASVTAYEEASHHKLNEMDLIRKHPKEWLKLCFIFITELEKAKETTRAKWSRLCDWRKWEFHFRRIIEVRQRHTAKKRIQKVSFSKSFDIPFATSHFQNWSDTSNKLYFR